MARDIDAFPDISVPSDRIAAERLVEAFGGSVWSKGPPKPSFAFDRDRRLNLLFEGTTRLDPAQALMRGTGTYYAPALEVGELLRWAFEVGLVGYDPRPGGPTWVLLRHGVTYIPRGRADHGHPDSFDARQALPTIGGMSLAALVKRETNRRYRMRKESTDVMLRSIRNQLKLCEANTTLPAELRGTDLPPVETIGEFRDNFSGFAEHLPTWRVIHVDRALTALPRIVKPVRDDRLADRTPSSPSELDDFEL